jgi:phosphatidylserine decarboxylase
MKKPTIAELETYLDSSSPPVKILPDGAVVKDFDNCPWKTECEMARRVAAKPFPDTVRKNKKVFKLKQRMNLQDTHANYAPVKWTDK